MRGNLEPDTGIQGFECFSEKALWGLGLNNTERKKNEASEETWDWHPVLICSQEMGSCGGAALGVGRCALV